MWHQQQQQQSSIRFCISGTNAAGKKTKGAASLARVKKQIETDCSLAKDGVILGKTLG